MLIEEKINEFLTKLNLTQYTDYLDDSFYVIGLSGLLFLIILFFFVSTSKVKDSNAPKRSTVKPNLDEIIDKKEIKINDENEFVDVLVAIEEEMLAIRELYIGGYISKGVYISETDRLYEKSKVFGL